MKNKYNLHEILMFFIIQFEKSNRCEFHLLCVSELDSAERQIGRKLLLSLNWVF